MSGVCQIYNTETNKRYIGSSIDVQRRLKEHLRNLKANRHCNQHLQNAWNRYREYLVFEPLEYCEPDQCLKLEQQYIDYYNSAEREASRTLGIDKGGIKYVIQHKEGYMKKLNCTFVLIDKIEFLANKVVGEK